MSAARVLNPVTDFCKIGAGVYNRTLPTQLNRIKRDLFGAAGSVETNKNFNDELDKHQEKAIKRWGFDFRNGSPLTAHAQYNWERVSFQESTYAPEMYTLTRAAHVRPATSDVHSMDLLMDERAERENYTSMSTDTDSCDDSQDESMHVFKVPAVVCMRHNGSETTLTLRTKSQLRKRQPKITEYMKERKRLAQTPKKVSPSKRMRTNSGGSVPHAVHSNSISSHFMVRSQRHQHQGPN